MENENHPALADLGLEQFDADAANAPDRKLTQIPEMPKTRKEVEKAAGDILADFDLPPKSMHKVYKRTEELGEAASRPVQVERRERKEADPVDLFVLEFSNAVKKARLSEGQQSAALDKIRDLNMRVSDPDSRKETIATAISEVMAPAAPVEAVPVKKVA